MMCYRVFLTILPLATGALGQSVSGEASDGAPTATYRNPVIADNLADPSVIRVKGLYYLYGTGQVDGDNGYRVYTSPDLIQWQRGPVALPGHTRPPGPPGRFARRRSRARRRSPDLVESMNVGLLDSPWFWRPAVKPCAGADPRTARDKL